MIIKRHIYSILVTVLTVAIFSCKNNFKEVQQIGISENEPIGIAEDLNLKYTDSGKVQAHLISDKMLDYSNYDFAFSEFPNGITLYLYDDNDNKTTIVSDYAKVYDQTGLIDLQGNVMLTGYDGQKLEAEQLYFDQNKEWMFTNQAVRFTDKDQVINGNGFDSNMDFTKARVLEINGVVLLDE